VMRRCETKNNTGAEAEEAGAVNTKCECKNPLCLPHWVYNLTGRALRSARPVRINCRQKFLPLTSGTDHNRGGRTSAHALSLRRSNRGAAVGRHVRLPTQPTTRAAAAPVKACPQRLTAAATAGIKWPGPLPSKEDPRAARAPGSDKTDPRRVRLPISGLEARSK
jgi:hypothetical protein